MRVDYEEKIRQLKRQQTHRATNAVSADTTKTSGLGPKDSGNKSSDIICINIGRGKKKKGSDILESDDWASEVFGGNATLVKEDITYYQDGRWT